MKFALAALALVTLTSGCYVQSQYGEPMPIETVDAALEGWVKEGNPATARCMDEAGELTMMDASKDEMLSKCPDAKNTTVGCTVHGTDWDGERHTSFLIREDLQGVVREDTIEHELRHWMAACSLGDSDHNHSNPHVWYLHNGRDVR